jgi:hypothetical protein
VTKRKKEAQRAVSPSMVYNNGDPRDYEMPPILILAKCLTTLLTIASKF